jgi:hypothetical protein
MQIRVYGYRHPYDIGFWDFHFFSERLAHPRREWKSEIKEGRYPPLDVASCSPVAKIYDLRDENSQLAHESTIKHPPQSRSA